MKVITSTNREALPKLTSECLPVILYGRTDPKEFASAGAALAAEINRSRLQPEMRAWDLLSIALSVIVADYGGLRRLSPDGWTREFETVVGVNYPDFWNGQRSLIEAILRFLTTDRWNVTFRSDVFVQTIKKEVILPDETCVTLLSGGVDSLVGTLDLVGRDVKPLAVSQTVLGDGEKQVLFSREIGGGLRHLQLNHNALSPGENERSQRARSFIFLAYGALAATTLRVYRDGVTVPLYVPENGFISINPPLTETRIGSLSTRTTHPVYFSLFQKLLDNAGLRVKICNPYRFKTKGEMLLECSDQNYLLKRAHEATSCGRFRRNRFRHCGRCIPCMIRRSSFIKWGNSDQTTYLYQNLGKADSDHAYYNDVRSAALAILTTESDGINGLLGSSIISNLVEDKSSYLEVVQCGLGVISLVRPLPAKFASFGVISRRSLELSADPG
jgi:hypothetical protein